jgi:hypothetical protein
MCDDACGGGVNGKVLKAAAALRRYATRCLEILTRFGFPFRPVVPRRVWPRQLPEEINGCSMDVRVRNLAAYITTLSVQNNPLTFRGLQKAQFVIYPSLLHRLADEIAKIGYAFFAQRIPEQRQSFFVIFGVVPRHSFISGQ